MQIRIGILDSLRRPSGDEGDERVDGLFAFFKIMGTDPLFEARDDEIAASLKGKAVMGEVDGIGAADGIVDGGGEGV